MMPQSGFAQSLQANWTMDDGSGSVATDAVAGNDGSLVNGPVWTTEGQLEGALDFDGQNDRVIINPAALGMQNWSGFTVAAWVKSDIGAGAGTDDIIGWWNYPGSRSWILTHHGNNQYFFEIAGKSFVTGGSVSTEWTHVAATYDGSAMRLFVNGTEVAVQGGLSGNLQNSSSMLVIGSQDDGSNYFNGLIDDVRLYDYALTEGEIALLTVVPVDETPPSVPQNLTVTSTDYNAVGLTWDVATDAESGVAFYEVFRDGVSVGQHVANSFTDTGLAEATTYTYRVAAVNGDDYSSAQSSPVDATTLSDMDPPTTTGISADANGVEVSFDEDLDPVTAQEPANYSIDGGVTVTAAELQPDGRTVVLTTSGAVEGVTYNLSISGVEDLAGNPIAPVSLEFTPVFGDPDLIAHWDMDDPAGSVAADVTGNGHDGSLTGDANFVSGLSNGAVALDGNGDMIRVDSAPLALDTLNQFTVLAWVKNSIGSGAGTDDIAGQWNYPNSPSWILTHHGNNQYFFEIAGKGYLFGGTVSTDWTLVAGTYDGSTMRLYQNGVEVASQGGLSGSLTFASADFVIGGQDDNSNYFAGLIDDVQLYSRALSAGELLTAYEDGAPEPDPGPGPASLISQWDLDEVAGTTAVDSAGGNNGSVASPVWTSGITGGALRLDGSSSSVRSPATPYNGLETFTAMAWVKNDIGAGAGTDDIMGQWNYPGSRSWIVTHHGNDQYFFEISGKGYLYGGTVSDEWTLITATYDGSTMRLYQNGAEVASQGGLSGALPISSADFVIGSQDDNSNHFDGVIDDVRIYDGALSAAEVLDAYNSELGVVPSGPSVVGGAPQNVQFSASDLVGDIVSYDWDFGDGGSSTQQNPSHQYTTNGNYVVTLTALSAGGATYTRTLDVQVGDGNPPGPPPVISIWYGDNQRFGDLGVPQVWLNILGDVQVDEAASLAMFTYSLNGGDPVNLSVGPDNRRLAFEGEFNVEMAITEVQDGANVVEITAIDTFGQITTETVNFNYDSSNEWPLPYSIDWDIVTDITDVAQVVDGYWTVENGGMRIEEMEYDRVVTIGDLMWDEYEITVPITINDYEPGYLGPQSVSAGFGMTFKWMGHTDDPVFCPQPHCGWLPSGAGAWYDIGSGGPLLLGGYTDNSVSMNIGDTFIWKMRVEDFGAGYLYSLKVWEEGQAEPTDYNLTRYFSTDLPSGCIILNCHHVDATFGDISIVPLP